ncbi:DUF2164 family protein [Xylophilus rhododendri]|uniref:DUF2164 family protein n=1 Tax=Xylophilus rhododendri TaxID=2697032 RepID=A0A857J040_9BURK|nr:DUF2164 family protein [Xylophilus rhododendri]QHI96643.1 DUF2164 family protein [Xylophilus rhododendri]
MSFQDKVTTQVIEKISNSLRSQLKKEFDIELGSLELAPISRHVIEEVGATFFNEGLQTALKIIQKRGLDIEDDIQCQEVST